MVAVAAATHPNATASGCLAVSLKSAVAVALSVAVAGGIAVTDVLNDFPAASLMLVKVTTVGVGVAVGEGDAAGVGVAVGVGVGVVPDVLVTTVHPAGRVTVRVSPVVSTFDVLVATTRKVTAVPGV